MPKLFDDNNVNNLTDDLAMYFRGTFVCKAVEKGFDVMYVDRVLRTSGDGSKLSHITFAGPVLKFEKDEDGEGDGAWLASEIDLCQPASGYYRLGGSVRYMRHQHRDKTQRKGFPDRVLLDGSPAHVSLKLYHEMVNPKKSNNIFSGQIALIKGGLYWKGARIGSLKDGAYSIEPTFEHLKEFVCKTLQLSLGETIHERS